MGIQIEKRAEKAGIVLAKRNINNINCQVKLGIDKSASMEWLYNNGTVQEVVERILAISLKVDKDGTVDIWAFNNNSIPVREVTVPLMENYVKKEIESKVGYGGTSFSPVFSDIRKSSQGRKGLFGFGAKAADPTLAIVITDGENDDESDAERVIREAQNENIYWLLVGIGNSSFSFIRRVGDRYPNAGFVAIKDITTIDDDDMFEALLNDELAEWFGKFKK